MIKVTVEAPDDILGLDEIIKQSTDAVNDTVTDTLVEFDSTKADFSSDSQFAFQVERPSGIKNGTISGSVFTDDENYFKLNNGFDIPPVAGKRMAFRVGYRAKTRPGSIRSRPGGQGGARIVRMSRRGSRVPPRLFDVSISEKLKPIFFERVQSKG